MNQVFEFLRLNWIFVIVTAVAIYFAHNEEIATAAIIYLIGISAWLMWALFVLDYDKKRALIEVKE